MSIFSLYTKEGKAMVSGLYMTYEHAARIAASKGWVAYDLQAVAAAARIVH